MFWIVYQRLIHPVRLRKELDQQKVSHWGVSYHREKALTLVAFRSEPDERTISHTDSAVFTVLKQSQETVAPDVIVKSRSVQNAKTLDGASAPLRLGA